ELNGRSLSRKHKYFFMSGQAIELWAFKTICGLFHSTVAAQEKEPLAGKYNIETGKFERALRLGRVDESCGLYVTSHVGQRNIISFAPLSVMELKQVIGIRFGFGAIEFDVVMDPRGVNFDYLRKVFFYRPWIINLSSQRRIHTMTLSWPDTPIGGRIVTYQIVNQQHLAY
ncbi:MAG: hypothetical protein WA624_10220, partial [Methylocella sp.]